MNKTFFKQKLLSVALCAVLIAVTALSMTGCTQNSDGDTAATTTTTVTTAGTTTTTVADTGPTRLGLGETLFTFEVEDKDGTKTVFEILTDEETVGAALMNLNLIAGDEGPYGLYVKTVNGITLDYDTDKLYWAFYINGEYAVTGVDATAPTAGATYAFKAQK